MDTYTKTTKTGWGQNIGKSVMGVLVGLAMFVASFVVLWNTEGRTNLGKVAEKAIQVSSGTVETAAAGQLVSVTGDLKTNSPVGDPTYLKPGPYVVVYRNVEMFAWVEETETETKKKTGGGSEETTTYRYVTEWTSSPQSSSEFEYPEGHTNPRMKVQPDTFYAPTAGVGAYTFDHRSATLPDAAPIMLTRDNAIAQWDVRLIGRDYLFMGRSFDTPDVGDIRISFEALNTGKKVTLFGKLAGSDIIPYYHKGKTRLYRALSGTHDEAIATLKTEHKVMGWILRIVGFLLMWIGLTLIYGPISAFLDVLPFLGKISRSLIAIVTFFIAIILTILTTVISMVFHNTIALIIFIVIVGIVLFFILTRKKKPATAPATPPVTGA
ncbi:TMEM43 family protein [candidate division WOR-3 bacterium]|nr:TMEM43 family protein [candidate division WOR-3 bacterium]